METHLLHTSVCLMVDDKRTSSFQRNQEIENHKSENYGICCSLCVCSHMKKHLCAILIQSQVNLFSVNDFFSILIPFFRPSCYIGRSIFYKTVLNSEYFSMLRDLVCQSSFFCMIQNGFPKFDQFLLEHNYCWL